MDEEQMTSTTPSPAHYNNQHGAVAVAPTILRFVISPQIATDLNVTSDFTFHEILVGLFIIILNLSHHILLCEIAFWYALLFY